MITNPLFALVGVAEAKRILFSGDRFDGAEAMRIGFAQAMADDPMEAARKFGSRLSDNAPLSIAGAKFMVDGLAMGPGTLDDREVQAIIDRASASDDYAERRRAFAEKRKPVFRGQ